MNGKPTGKYLFTTDNDRTLIIAGSVNRIPETAPEAPRTRRHHYGTRGMSEIRGLQGGRLLRGNAWVFGPDLKTEAQIKSKIEEIRYFVNEHGKLEVFATDPSNGLETLVQTFQDVTFDSYTFPATREGLPMMPLEDVGGCLGGGWWVEVFVDFYQLVVPNFFEIA